MRWVEQSAVWGKREVLLLARVGNLYRTLVEMRRVDVEREQETEFGCVFGRAAVPARGGPDPHWGWSRRNSPETAL